MQPASQERRGEASVRLGCFEVAGRVVAVEIGALREIVRYAPPAPLPGAPALVEGVIDLRGELVPVVDLGRALGWAAGRPGDPVRERAARARIAVAEIEGLRVGLLVDAALEILVVDGAALGDPPPLALQAGREATRAVVRRPEAPPIAVIALEAVLEAVYRAALAPTGEEQP